MSMALEDALAVITKQRSRRVVISTMGSVAVWPELSDSPLDFHYIPSSMGQGPALGLGLALAQPNHGAIVLCGDGSLLMNLGCLVTIAQHPAPLWIVLLDNGQYEITGGQPVAGAGRTDFAALAKAAGISRVYSFEMLLDWQNAAARIFEGDGPVFVWLRIIGRPGIKTPSPPKPMMEQIVQLREALAVDD